MPAPLRVLLDPPGDPALNMAVDAALLESAEGPVLRLYRWRPFALSLGWFQSIEPAEVARLESEGYALVRRITGGGAIFHAHELTYSLCGADDAEPFRGPVDRSYRLVHAAVLEVLRARGVRVGEALGAPATLSRREQPFLCFGRSTALDLVTEDGKLVGSAKRRRRGRALQHGSLLLQRHVENGPGAAALEESLGAAVDPEALAHDLARAIARRLGLGVEVGALRAGERALAARLREQRFGDRAWTLDPRDRGDSGRRRS